MTKRRRRDHALICEAVGELDGGWREQLASPSPELIAAFDAIVARVDARIAAETLGRALRKSARLVRGENDSEPPE